MARSITRPVTLLDAAAERLAAGEDARVPVEAGDELGRLAATDTLRAHLDRCLACRACEAVCPSGVGYGALIENARASLEEHGQVPRSAPARWLRRLALATLADPARLEAAAGALSLYERTGLRRLLRATGLRDRMPRVLRRLEALYPPLTRPRYKAPAAPAQAAGG